MRTIEIYDTTLRDGSQGEGVTFSLEDKLAITRRLDEAGVDFIEGGYPLSNPKDAEYFQQARELTLERSRVAAFGMTRRRGLAAADDPGMKALLDALGHGGVYEDDGQIDRLEIERGSVVPGGKVVVRITSMEATD